MLQKFRSSILFQLICMVALIFAVLFTTFHAAQAYVRSLSVSETGRCCCKISCEKSIS